MKGLRNHLLQSSLVGFTVAAVWSCIAESALSAEPLTDKGSATVQTQASDLMELSIEELMEIEVSPVTKRTGSLDDVPGAVFVLTQEDIRRSGTTSIPEALRLVPGLYVARIDANKWVVSARGVSGRFSDGLLVMIDGRTVYSPLFAGVFWEVQDTLLEDIDRIEVLLGPTGTMWGANATNGLIHIITKTAAQTQGGLVTMGVGSEERGFAGARYGGKIGENIHYRVYGKGFNRDISFSPEGAHDDWRMAQGGFRAAGRFGTNDTLTFQGDYYTGQAGQQINIPTLTPPSFTQTRDEDVGLSGGNVLLRWGHSLHQESNLALQLYYDRTRRDEVFFKENRGTYDVDFLHRFSLPFRQEVTWGLGYRLTTDRLRNSPTLSFDPVQRDLTTVRGYVQDEVRFYNDRVRVNVGVQLSEHTFTGLMVDPSARVLWLVKPQHRVWTSIARAHRVPSRLERDARHIEEGTADGFVETLNNPNQRPEDRVVYELGYRGQLSKQVSLDISTFYSFARNFELEVEESDTSSRFTNNQKEKSYGGEIGIGWDLLDWWRLRAGFAYRQTHDIAQAGGEAASNESSQHQVTFRSLMNVSRTVELDTAFRYLDRIPNSTIPSYSTVDVRVGWHLRSGLELSLAGQNLLNRRHLEQLPSALGTQPTQVERGVVVKLSWHF